eukprot:UN11942
MCVGARLQKLMKSFQKLTKNLQKTHVEEEKTETVVPVRKQVEQQSISALNCCSLCKLLSRSWLYFSCC